MKMKRLYQLASFLFGLSFLLLLLSLVFNFYDQGLSTAGRNRNIILMPIMLVGSVSMFYMSKKMDENKAE